MTNPRPLSRLLGVVLLPLALALAATAAEATKTFDVPAGEAAETLKQFAQQAGQQVVYPAAEVRGVRTTPVQGDFTVRAGLARLLAGTPLHGEFDERSGTFAVSRAAPPPAKKEPARVEPTATARAAKTPDAAEIITLNAFTVTAAEETGYLAGNSISATKNNTPIKDLPINVTVITEQVLKDIAATQATDALAYSSSVTVTTQQQLNQPDGGINFDGQVSVRGSGTFFSLRNGARAYDQPSAQIIQRMEIVKGPASVLYGVTKPGGVVNYITKTPELGRNRGELNLTYSSYDTFRATLDVNYGRLFDDRVGLRLNASRIDGNTWYDFSAFRETLLAPSLSLRPFANTRVTVAYEHVERRKPNGQNFPTSANNAYRGPAGETIFGAVIPWWETADILRYLSPNPTTPTTPPARNTIADLALNPRFTFRGNLDYRLNPIRNLEVEVTQTFSEHLTANFKYAYNRRDNTASGFQSPAIQFPGTNDTSFIAAPVAAFPRLRMSFREQTLHNDITNLFGTVLYKRTVELPLVGTVRNTAVVGGQIFEENYEQHFIREFVPGTATQIFYTTPLLGRASNLNYPVTRPTGTLFGDTQFQKQDNHYRVAYASWLGQFFNNRVILNGALTEITFRQKSRQQFNATPLNPRPPEPSTRFDTSKASPLVGLMARPTTWASFYVQYAKSLNPNTAGLDGFGNLLPPEIGKGHELGLKLDPWQGRLSANLGVFRIEEANRVVTDPNAPNLNSLKIDRVTGQIVPITGPNDPDYDPNQQANIGGSRGGRASVGLARTEGFDIDVVASPLRNLQLIFSYSYNDTYSIRDTDATLANYSGRPLPATIYNKASALAHYRFEGTLKGWSVVGGLRWRGKAFIDLLNAADGSTNIPADRRNVIFRYAPELISNDVRVAYATKLMGYNWQFALNVRNLGGSENFFGFRPGSPYSQTPYTYKLPADFSFTTGVKF